MKVLSILAPLTTDEFNTLPVNDRADLLWGPEGKGKFMEAMSEYGKFKIGLYMLDENLISVYYDLDSNRITDIKAWVKNVDKKAIMENISMN